MADEQIFYQSFGHFPGYPGEGGANRKTLRDALLDAVEMMTREGCHYVDIFKKNEDYELLARWELRRVE